MKAKTPAQTKPASTLSEREKALLIVYRSLTDVERRTVDLVLSITWVSSTEPSSARNARFGKAARALPGSGVEWIAYFANVGRGAGEPIDGGKGAA